MITAVITAVITGCSTAAPVQGGSVTTSATPTSPTSSITATSTRSASLAVVATGDVLIHQGGALVEGAAAAGRAQGTGYDFSGVFTNVAPVIGAADLAICHLEVPLAPPEGPFEGYPTFAAQPQVVDALAGAGYDTCSTASNHSMDAGFPGLVRTLDTLDATGIGHTGTFRTAQDSQTPRGAAFRAGNGKWVAYGLGNHIAQQDLSATYDSVIARFHLHPRP